jgi:hypothetical protein
MNRIFTLTVACLLCALSSKAVLKTWVGASGGAWNTAGNWAPSGVPTFNDTALFNTSVTVSVDINPSLAALQVKNNATVIFSAAASRLITIGNGGTPVEALLIQVGSSLTLGSGAAVSIQTSGSAATNTANIYGTLILGQSASAWTVAPFSSSPNNCIANIYGTVQVATNNTGSVITGTATNNLRFYAGSFFQGQRNGGSVPGADYQNGSTINITGVTSSNVVFNTPANFNGLINWNCSGQTISGSSANTLPSPSITIDSLRIQSTGTGTVRLTTAPAGFTIGHLQVDGGTLELSAPGSSGRFGTVNTDFIITGGNVIGNATFAFDNIAPDSMRLNVNGNFIMSNGSFDLSNRPPALLSGGSFGMVVRGFFVQSGGTITASSSFAGLSPSRINYIQLQGTTLQQLYMSNWTGPIQLIADNSNGILLLSNITCPDTLYLKSGYMQLDNNHVQVVANKFKTQTVLPTPHFVTSGTGHVKFTNLASFATAVFPVSPNANSNSSVILRNGDATANTFDVRAEVGNNPGGIFNTGLTVNRTWIINAANTFSLSNPVELTFVYPNTALNVLCNRNGPMELGHFVNPTWNVDPVGPARTPLLGASFDTTGTFAPNTLDSAFVLGNQFSILNLRSGITLNYFKGNKRGTDNMLNWAVNCTSNQAKFEVQRSGNGISFNTIANITASFDRCLQPFDFMDSNPLAGLNYYRIKITDIDGTVSFSTFVLLQNKACAPGGMALLPTLVNQSAAVICLDAITAMPVQFVITDISGRPVQRLNEKALIGQNQFTLHLGQLVPGVYYLAAYGANQKWEPLRFVKL